ncbi:glycosyltransferase family 2 protein [Thermodesulfobacteriota bacterium]
MKKFFYTLLHKYLSLYILSEDSLVEIDPSTDMLVGKFERATVLQREERFGPELSGVPVIHKLEEVRQLNPDYILLNGLIHTERDIQSMLSRVREQCSSETRLIVTYYSSLWKPLMKLATWLGLRSRLPETNWIAHEDISNLLLLADFEPVRSESRILLPVYIPLVSQLVNQFIAPLPFFRNFNMVNIVVARPVFPGRPAPEPKPSVSVVVAARNEAGNIENIVKRLPRMGPDDELIFVEGGSSDTTWETIQAIQAKYRDSHSIVIAQQDGKGKGDAVRKGFGLASRDILMILDADMTVPPEDLPRFYDAIVADKGEYINGSRLVYPMEKEAMRFFNLCGNKFFAMAFSFVLGQSFKDTLCGTKVISRKNYEKLARHRSFFGEFDPFGDFDLIFGASRMCLKIVEIPITYRERVYGDTNISRWSHGSILFAMLLFAARKIKFL